MSADQQYLAWGAVVCVIMFLFAGFLGYSLFSFLKKGTAILASRYGRGVEYSRASQPIKYWIVMLFYTLALLVVLYVLFINGHELVESLLKSLSNH
jgi:hypothetical protein